MNVQETSTGVAQLLRSLPFRELMTFADAMRACADRGADALTCAEAIDAWAHGDTDQVDGKYGEGDNVSAGDGTGQREHGPQGSDHSDRGEERRRPDGPAGDRAPAHGRDDGERAHELRGGHRGARPAEGRLARVDETPAAAVDAADTSSGVDAPERPDADRAGNADHERLPPQTPPAGGDKPAGAFSEHQNDGVFGTGCQPSSAAGDQGPNRTPSPAASGTSGDQLIGNDDAILRAIISLQADGAAVSCATIAERSSVPKTSISWHVGSLERKGWIRRSGPAGARAYEVLAHPDGEALPQASAPQPTHTDPTDQARKSLKTATQQSKCAVCRSQPAVVEDLCTHCAQLKHRAPGVGEGPLPHYDERKRQEAAEDVRRRHQRARA